MTRKRFVKLLMGDRISRNEANRYAKKVNPNGAKRLSSYDSYDKDVFWEIMYDRIKRKGKENK